MDLDKIKTELRLKVPGFAARVAPVYKVLGWQWSPGSTGPHIPLAPEIETLLYELIEGLTEEYTAKGSGGLEAYYMMPEEDESGCFGLVLRIEDQEFFDK